MRATRHDVVVDSWDAVTALGPHVVIGHAFAFVQAAALSAPSVRWLTGLLGSGEPPQPQVVPLLGQQTVEIAGARLSPWRLPVLRLSIVTSDKALYREGRDAVHLLIADPAAPSGEAVAQITLDGVEYTRHTLRLDGAGAGALTLRDLPAGDYEVRLASGESDPACEFTVAEYRLSPLVASLADRRLEGEKLALTLRLESFGVAVEGGVRVELMDRGRRVAETRGDARQGLVRASFVLEGDGPHSLNIQLAADPSRTATVPLTGSRASERSATSFSTLGSEVTATLLPSAEARAIRGLFLSEGALATTPFRIEGFASERPRLVAAAAAEKVRVIIVDPRSAQPPRMLEPGSMAAGAEIELPLAGPLTWVAIGGFVSGQPWEGWAALLAPESASARVELPEKITPGGELELIVTSSAASGSAYLVVKDARLLTGDSPASRMAGQLKAHVEAEQPAQLTGRPTDTLAAIAEPPPEPMMAPTARAVAFAAPPDDDWGVPDDGPMLAAEFSLGGDDSFEGPETAMDGSSDEELEPTALATATAVAARTVTRVDDPDVLFAGLVRLEAGRASVRLRLPAAFADYVAEAFVLADGDWAAAGARFRAEKETYAILDLPAFVHPKDTALARLHAASRGRMRVHLEKDGAPATLLLDGRPLSAGETLPLRRAELTFYAEPGEYAAVVEDLETGAADRTIGRVDAPGALRRLSRALRLLERGESVALADDPAVVGLRVLPGIDSSFRLLVDATADYGHACCEQTAAKILAACALYAFADEASRGKAEAIILAGIRREQTMHLPGRGLRMYPESSGVDDYWGPKAARYLWNLAVLEGLGPSAALSEGIKAGLAIAADATRAYGLAWPPRPPTTCEEAWGAFRFEASDAARSVALALARSNAAAMRPAIASGAPPPRGAVLARCEAAFAAATLLRGGLASDRQAALFLANAVLKDLEASGRMYSTVDSVAAIALLGEVRSAGFGGAGRVALKMRAGEDRDLSVSEAALVAPESIAAVTVSEGGASVELTRLVAEDWEALATNVDASFALVRGGQPTRKLRLGDAVDLRVTLKAGYRAGDILWVCLPPSLTRVVGGGQVKRFSLDFEGRAEASVPLAVTSPTVDRLGSPAPQRFAACVRNMFEEERAANPGLIEVWATRPA